MAGKPGVGGGCGIAVGEDVGRLERKREKVEEEWRVIAQMKEEEEERTGLTDCLRGHISFGAGK